MTWIRRGLGLAVAVTMTLIWATPASADSDMRELVAEMVKAERSASGALEARWSSGLRLTSADKRFKLKLGGRIMLDHWWVDDDSVAVPGSLDDGIEARRVRFYNAGLIYGNVEYKLQLEFATPNAPEFKDVYIGLTHLDDCFGCLMPSVRVGHFKAPFGLENMSSSKYMPLMERTAASNTLVPGRTYGVMLHDKLYGDRFTWAAGWFASQRGEFVGDPLSDDGDLDFDSGYCFAGRVTYTPWVDCDCACRVLHLGLGLAYCDLGNGRDQAGGSINGRQVRFRARPYTHDTGLRLVDTGNFIAQDFTMFNAELALVYGPWSLQAEYFLTDVSSTAGDDPTFTGWYVQASYWLTGECRNYKAGKFGRVKPCCNFLDDECCCYGGWELAVRYDEIDLEDANVAGGEQGTLVVGVNWLLNPNTRVMFNYFRVDVDGGPQQGGNINNSLDLDGIGVRVQVDW